MELRSHKHYFVGESWVCGGLAFYLYGDARDHEDYISSVHDSRLPACHSCAAGRP